ncbi:MAG: hypothetical protein WEB59_06275 [Thermoanaerobaculia bacterium]
MRLFFAILLFASSLLGCRERGTSGPTGAPSRLTIGPVVDGPLATPTPTLEARVKELESDQRASARGARLLGLKVERLDGLNTTVVTLDASQPGSGYQQIVTNSGRFLVSLANAEPYLDGFRITLEIGNITSATYHGFELDAEWPPAIPEKPDADNMETWSKKTEAQKRKFSFTDDLTPGAWTRVRLSLTPAAAEDVKAIEISMETSQIGLRKPR